MKGYFVTGTDTGVGKTFVACALARAAKERGLSVFAFKPIETGVIGNDGEDQQLLCDAAGGWQVGRLRGVYRFRQPAAPRVAAEAEGARIDLAQVQSVFTEGLAALGAARNEGVFAITEGAGGWRVPITAEGDTSALAKIFGLPIIVVARAGLGTINHSLLTVEAVERDGCSVAALVLSERASDDPEFTTSNAAEICARWRGLVVIARERSVVGDVSQLI